MWLLFPFLITNNFPADGCYNYRRSTYSTPIIGDVFCDNLLSEGWYRFEGAAGTRMPTTVVPPFKCGTDFSGWLNGAQPTLVDGEVNRKVCFTGNKDNCKYSNHITVKNCGSFLIYKLIPPTACSLRYCGGDWLNEGLKI